ncbi:MAG TPA: hypothetical protein VK559_13430 [Ferruginibacter sp.]|nr:hypothetical protein [Ferruginibacter sp.]
MKKNKPIAYYGYSFPAYNTPINTHTKDKQKKAVLVKYDDAIKLVKFGLKGMEDYTQHYDEKRRANYLSRSAGIKDKTGRPTKDDPFSANYWSRRVLWGSGEELLEARYIDDTSDL